MIDTGSGIGGHITALGDEAPLHHPLSAGGHEHLAAQRLRAVDVRLQERLI
jgi:hypothetical protein